MSGVARSHRPQTTVLAPSVCGVVRVGRWLIHVYKKASINIVSTILSIRETPWPLAQRDGITRLGLGLVAAGGKWPPAPFGFGSGERGEAGGGPQWVIIAPRYEMTLLYI